MRAGLQRERRVGPSESLLLIEPWPHQDEAPPSKETDVLTKRMKQGLGAMALAPLALAANLAVTAPETEPNESAHCHGLYRGMVFPCQFFGVGSQFGNSSHFY